MAVTGTSVAAASTMLAAAAAIFVTLVLCFYLFLCAKRYRGAAPTLAGGRARFVFASATGAGDGGGGMAEQAIAALPRKEVAPGEDPAADCAVCLAELAAGEAARVLPRCGHAFHVACVDVWLRAHSTCPLCRCAVVDDEVEVEVAAAAARAPEADLESPAFPTNVLFFGSQDTFSTRGAAATASLSPLARESPRLSPPPQQQQQQQHPAPGPIAGVAAVVEAARAATLRRLLACRGATPVSPSSSTPQREDGRDLESGESSGSPPAKPPQSGS